MTSTTKEYMQEWRKTERGKQQVRANSRAQGLAVKWVREHHPEAWIQLMAQAREECGLPTEIGPSGGFTKAIEHGTHAGYRAHIYRKEKACDPCRDAQREHQKAYRERKAQA